MVHKNSLKNKTILAKFKQNPTSVVEFIAGVYKLTMETLECENIVLNEVK